MRRQRAGSPGWPTLDAPLLRDVASAFLSRRKALRYQAGLSCGREFSETAGGVLERFNLDLWGGRVRLSVWADGGLWLLVCVPGQGRHSGWSFQDSFHGGMCDVSAQALVGMVEATLARRSGRTRPGSGSGCGNCGAGSAPARGSASPAVAAAWGRVPGGPETPARADLPPRGRVARPPAWTRFRREPP